MITQTTFLDLETPNAEPLNRLREAGPRALSDSELLYCLLQSERAANLVAEHDLWRVDPDTIPDLTPSQVTCLKAALEIGRRFTLYQQPQRPQITSPADAAAILMPLIGHEQQEHFVVIPTDTRNHVITVKTLYIGTLNTSIVRIAEVIEIPMRYHAAGLIISHCHPSGDPSPSPEDVALTHRIRQAAEVMELTLLDHIVIGHNSYISLRERNLGFDDVEEGFR